MNVLDLEIFTREYMRQYIKASQPNMDISENSAFDDIFIKPMISVLSPIFPLVTNTELKSNLKFANYLTDEEVADIGVNNYSVARQGGYTGTTAQTFGFSRVGEKGITIPQGVVVTTPEGLVYTTTHSTTYSKEEVKQGYNANTGTYDIIAYIKADDIGAKYNVGENTINICQTPFNDYLVYTSNKNAVTDGADQESLESYVSRIRTYYADQHLGTSPGYIRWLRDVCPEFTNQKVIGYLDDGMERDTVEIVSRNAQNEIVFEPRENGHYYAATKKRHIGGCVDIYVRGSEYAVETVRIPSGSNIICVNGPIKADGDKPILSVTDNDSYNGLPVQYEVSCIKRPAEKSPSSVDDNIKWYVASRTDKFNESTIDITSNMYGTEENGVTDVSGLELKDVVGGYYALARKADFSGEASIVYANTGSPFVDFKINVLSVTSENLNGYSISGIKIEYSDTMPSKDAVWKSIDCETEASLIPGTDYYNVALSPKEMPANAMYVRVLYVENEENKNGMLHSVSLISETVTADTKVKSAINESLMFANLSGEPSVAVTTNLNSLPCNIATSDGEIEVVWQSSNSDVISEEGGVTRQDEAENVTLTATIFFKTSSGTDAKCVKSFNIVVLSRFSDVWEKCNPEESEKMIIYIDKTIKNGNIKVKYTEKSSSEDEPDQEISNVYKVGFERAKMNGPLSESLLTASFSDSDEAWTQGQYRDWGEQLKIAFNIDLEGLVEDASADETQDILENIEIKRYKLTTNEQLLSSGEVDDDGFDAAHSIHEYDSYFIGSSQETVYALPITESESGISVSRLLPNTSVSGTGITVSYSYNNSLNNVQSAMFVNNDRIVTNDVLVREANRTPVNIALKLKVLDGAELTSAKKSQIYAAIQSLFDTAGINGRVEQSDIVGKLYTDPTTSTFVEYIRLALDAFYCPDDINKDIEYKNLGDYIEADSCSYLYLNKLLVTGLDDAIDTKVFSIYTVNEILDVVVDSGAQVVGTKVKASAQYGENGDVTVDGVATILSINGAPKTTVAEIGKTYSVNWLFEADDDRYENGYISGTVTCN